MDLQKIGYVGDNLAYKVGHGDFSVEQFDRFAATLDPLLFLIDGQEVRVYQFHNIVRPGDLVREWNDGKMQPHVLIGRSEFDDIVATAASNSETAGKLLAFYMQERF